MNKIFTQTPFVKFIWISLLFSVPFNVSFATHDNNLRVQHYTAEEGLAQNYVDCIYRDSRDFIWVGTWYGLNRFDGYNFISYRPDPKKNSISDGFINAIVEDKNGDLWIATRKGINKFVFETEEFIHFLADTNPDKNHISDNWITSLLFDQDNNLWIGTSSAGVEKISFNESLTEIKSVKHFNVDFLDSTCISSENIYCLLQGSTGDIYVGSLFGLDRINPQTSVVSKYQNLFHPFYFEATVVHSLFEDSENILWIGTESGLISIDHANNNLIRYPVDLTSMPGSNKKALSHGLVKAINEDKHGNILVGTLGGLHILDQDTQEFYLFPYNKEKDYSLNSKFIHDVFCDQNGNVWVGTDKGGLNKYNVFQKQFQLLMHDTENNNSLNHNIINTIYEDEQYLWIGTAGGGLNKYDKKADKYYHYKHIPGDNSSISLDFISAITSNSKTKELWLGTWGAGINHAYFSENTSKLNFKTYRYDPPEPYGPPYIYVSSVTYDRSGNLWIGRTDGLEIYNYDTKEFYQVQPGSAFGEEILNVGCLFIDDKENMWIGTTVGLRMLRLKGKTLKQLTEPDSIFTFTHEPAQSSSINGDFIVSMLQDTEGSMWFSVYGKGLSKMDSLHPNGQDASFSHFTMDDGLSNSVVYGMLEDDHNNLWLSTDRGLTCYNYKDKNTTVYYESDGLQSNQFYWSAYHKSKSGIMYFGSANGLIYFHPDSIKQNLIKPKVVITDFKLFNQSQLVNQENAKLSKTISETKKIELNYDENIISFEFSALSYYSPGKNMYRYKMEGFDNDWTITSADRRYVTYTNLDPGTYYFQVEGSNNDGVWNEKEAALELIIHPPWWKTVWYK